MTPALKPTIWLSLLHFLPSPLSVPIAVTVTAANTIQKSEIARLYTAIAIHTHMLEVYI